ncbi:thioredoxin domain-containing protein [Engelhardtia mirabilis]|uniref:Thioredoxin-2 n=1 Tax=Engelhardtia mirabilis TaxID=2528011 RepID=A0A518BR00_9BACT|nr:Thioredoxin-2 [Planctomycetes bacterium Pla133]QDV03721.1 Thioredoxin-2 [Planctomycetes bacterium Pla86]
MSQADGARSTAGAGGASPQEQRIQIPCPLCGALNRVPPARVGDHPRCGKCRAPFLEGLPFAVTGRRLGRFTQKCDLPFVLDAWATWCGPCKVYAPAYAEVAGRMRGRVLFGKLDIDAEQQTAAQLQITGVPTTILFAGGREVDRFSGARGADALFAWLAGQLDTQSRAR